ncbi:hypothetical protein ASD80_14395 [Devosia sp. Root635]|nr:hypothetical protein ASD80_14395 [Devosia sp. Root635]
MAIMAVLPVIQPTQAVAQLEDFVRGVGTVIAVCALTQSCGNQRPANNAPRQQAPAAPRAQPNPTVMADQQALNYFGFPAGTADGLSGSKTRNAISTYQGYMGYPVTGALTDYERSTLISGYQRAMSGLAGQYPNVVAAEGQRGLLRGIQREAQGLPFDPSARPAAPPVVQAAAQGTTPTPQAAAPTMPTFASKPVDVSMTQFCSEINLLTRANGSPVTANSITDPQFALNEQFCFAREYAISRTQQLSAEIHGVSDADLQLQCEGLVGVMAAQVARLGETPAAELTAGAAEFVRTFGMPNDQLIATGEICLGLGYRIDDAAIAVASTTVLVGAGRGTYGEMFGHHLRKGFGTTANADAARDWYGHALGALDGGQEPAFLPTQSAERAAVMRNALDFTTAAGTALPGATDVSLQFPAMTAAN